MKKWMIIAVAAGAYGVWALWGHFYVTTPLIRKSGAAVFVGADQGDHALFAMKPGREVRGRSLGYEFNSFPLGFGDVRKVGGRAMFSFMDSGTYERILATNRVTGQCMAGFLNQSERNGEISHVVLIPDSAATLTELQKITLKEGAKFRMTGRDLDFETGSVGGGAFHGKMRGLGYFLVESIQAD